MDRGSNERKPRREGDTSYEIWHPGAIWCSSAMSHNCQCFIGPISYSFTPTKYDWVHDDTHLTPYRYDIVHSICVVCKEAIKIVHIHIARSGQSHGWSLLSQWNIITVSNYSRSWCCPCPWRVSTDLLLSGCESVRGAGTCCAMVAEWPRVECGPLSGAVEHTMEHRGHIMGHINTRTQVGKYLFRTKQ